jgi:hypothetical protein
VVRGRKTHARKVKVQNAVIPKCKLYVLAYGQHLGGSPSCIWLGRDSADTRPVPENERAVQVDDVHGGVDRRFSWADDVCDAYLLRSACRSFSRYTLCSRLEAAALQEAALPPVTDDICPSVLRTQS